MVQSIFNEFAKFPQVEAMAIGGSRPLKRNDDFSDYDIYVYCSEEISSEQKRAVLEQYCDRIEEKIYQETCHEFQDKCIMKDGIHLDITYRKAEDLVEKVAEVVEQCVVKEDCATVLWHHLDTCRIIYDKGGKLGDARERFRVPYPEPLKAAVIERSMNRIKRMPDNSVEQIKIGFKRKDYISVNRYLAEFFTAYFDLLYAYNGVKIPGSRNLLERCKADCEILPVNYEQSINALFLNLNKDNLAMAILNSMVTELEKMIGK